MSSAANTPSNRILVIDDNPDIHADFRTVLTGEKINATLDALENELFGGNQPDVAAECPDYELEFALQGREGLDKLLAGMAAGRPFAVAFVDMRMPPGWDGLETIQNLWQADPGLQVVICTAYSDHSQREIVATLGRRDNLLILKKPFDPEEVAQLACAMVTKREMTRLANMTLQQLENLVAERTEALARAQFHDSETRRKMEKLSRRYEEMKDKVT